MSLSKVLLIGKRNEEIVGLKQQLAKGTNYEVELVSLAQRVIQAITTTKVDLCVFNFDLFTKDKIKIATDLRALGYEFPVLVLSRIISMDAYEAISNMQQTILLEKPYEQKDLHGLADKLITKTNVAQRHHRRFYTNQWANVAPFRGGNETRCRVFNLSRGGAYLEMAQANVKKGDVVQLNVELKEVYRKYNVNAKVIWTSSSGLWGTGQGVGVEFMKAKDVYRDLLQKL